MTFERARTEEKKGIRVKTIKDAALKLFYSKSYSEISMAGIAKELNFTRGNLYKYYQTKEAIYLDIIIDDFILWISNLEKKLSEMPPETTEEFITIWVEISDEHSQLIKLFSIMLTILERNTTLDKLVSFKKALYAEIPKLILLIKTHLPTLSEKQIMAFLDFHIHYSVGLYPFCSPCSLQLEAVKQSQVPYTFPNYKEKMTEHLTIYLSHILKTNDSGNL